MLIYFSIVIVLGTVLGWYFYSLALDSYESQNKDVWEWEWQNRNRLQKEVPLWDVSSTRDETDDRVTYQDTRHAWIPWIGTGYQSWVETREQAEFDRNGRFVGSKPSLALFIGGANLLLIGAICFVGALAH
jgi:hypothetical protein